MRRAWKATWVSGVLAGVGLGLAACATQARLPAHFFAVPAMTTEPLGTLRRTEFKTGEAIVLVAAGEAFDGREVRPRVFRAGIAHPIYEGRPVVMTGAAPQWWPLGSSEPGRYFVHLQVDHRRAAEELYILVEP